MSRPSLRALSIRPILAVLAMLAFLAAGAVNQLPAQASGTTLYVDSSSSACNDAGTGTPTAPYCSIIKAAQVVQAGQTVDVVGGTYTGSTINPANTGLAGSPITFTASAGVTISGGNDAFAISSRSYIVIDGFTVTSTSNSGISVSSSNHITVSNNAVTGSGQRVQGSNAAGISLSGTSSSLVTHNRSDNNSDHGIILQSGSSNNTVSFNEASLNAEGWQRNANGINVTDTGSTGNVVLGNVVHDNEDSGLQFYPGANNGVAENNVTYNNGDHGIDDLNVTGGELIGNTVYHNCTSGINVEGTSGNYTVMNNISVDNAVYSAYKGISCNRRTGNIGIYDSAPASTVVDYNFVYLTKSGDLYVWNNTSYSSPAALCAATGQECHGIQADPKWISWTTPNFRLQEGSAAIDSANSGAPGESTVDADNNPRVDDPSTPNTGAGPRTYDDRGAFEFQPSVTDTQPPTVPTGLTATATAPNSVALAWNASTDNVGVAGYTVYRNSTAVATVSSPGHTDLTVAANTTYTYAVDAFDSAGNHSAQSSSVQVTTPAPDTQPPSVPTGLATSGTTSSTVGLTWAASTDNVGVTGYAVYRNGTSVGTSTTTAFTDSGLTPATGYTYTVDAFDAAGNHSAQSAPVSATTSAPPVTYVQSGTYSNGNRHSAVTIVLKGRANAGDLLTGLFGQWDAAGQVQVSDNVNGTWTRAQGIKYSTGKGDVALYYVANSKGSATGLTITITASASTILTGTVGEYSGVGLTTPLDQVALRSGTGITVDSGATASILAGELVFGAVTANNNTGTVTAGASQGLTFTVRSAAGRSADADILIGKSGAQDARFSLQNNVTWYALAATFRPLAVAADTTPPSTPTGLTAANGTGSVSLSWNASTDNIGVTGYTVYRNGSALATVSGTTLAYTDGTVASATAYTYNVDAFDAAGNHSSQSAPVGDTTLDWIAPTVPVGLTATATGPTQVNLAWGASADNVAVAGYTVYRNGLVLVTVSGNTLAITDTTAAPATSYSYTVDAFDAAGNHSAPSSAAAVTTPGVPDTTPPSTPGGLAAVNGTGNVSLSWNASTDDVGVAGYTVYRNGSALATVSGTTPAYTDTTVASATSYNYAVDAFDAAGNHSTQSAPVSDTTLDWTAPTMPGGLAAVNSIGSVGLSWHALSDNVGVAGYTMYRNGLALATVSGTTLSYTDSTVASATSYTYAVDAFDAAGNHSSPTAPVSDTTLDWTAPTVPVGLTAIATGPTQVNLAWSASSDNVGVAGYTIYRNGSALATVSGTTLSYTDTTAVAGTTYSYTVDAFDAAGNHSAQSAAAVVTTPTPDTTPPSVPSGLVASAPASTQVNLSWSASTDNTAVTGYTVYRNGSSIATVSGSTLSYTDNTAAASTTYAYTVDAFDAAGNYSSQSTPASVTTPAPTGDVTPPSVPGAVAAVLSGTNQVTVSWNASTDNVGVTGYTVYRNGSALGTVAASALSLVDGGVSPGTTYSYTVDAFDAAGNHSAQSTPVSVHVPAVVRFVQGKAATSGARVTSWTQTLGAVAAGDLLVGWFAQYDSTGQVHVSDSVNGAWTRSSASTTWSGTSGDVALFYVANAAAAPAGLTITITAGTATYLQGSPAEYSGVAASNPLDQAVAAKGSGTSADSGLTPATGVGELVYGGMTTTNNPGTLTPGSSQGLSFVKRAQSSSGSQSLEDIVAGAAGQQHAAFTFTTSTPWFIVCAVFRAA